MGSNWKLENWEGYDRFGSVAYKKGQEKEDRIERAMRRDARKRRRVAKATSFVGEQTESNAAYWKRVSAKLQQGMTLEQAKQSTRRLK